ncbi:MAG: type 4a pilus biogenesis protein PilO [Panacagrimonas sp.]
MNLQTAIADLRSLDLQNPGIWPTWVHVAAAILACVILVLAGTWFKLMPMSEQLGAAKQQEKALFSEFERKQKKVASLDAYKQQLREMERSFGAMLRQLPSRSEVANLLNDISQARVASSLEEELFQPQPEAPKEFYAEIPNQIVVTGSYHEMGSFVSGVASLPRIVTIDGVEIRAAKPATGSRGDKLAPLSPGDLRMTAVAKTYRYLDESEIEAATAEKTKAQKGARKKK